MKPDLLLICNQFPFSYGETFLEIEFPYLHKSFNKIIVLSRNDFKGQTRDLPSNVTLIQKSPTSTMSERIRTIFSIGFQFKSFVKLLQEEKLAYYNIFKQRPDHKIKRKMLHDAVKAYELKSYIKNNIYSYLNKENLVLYSYWQNNAALALALLKKEEASVKSICRAHGGDLYFYVKKYNYQSFRKFLSENLDKIFFISEYGFQYQSELLKSKYTSYSISKLGTHILKSDISTAASNTKIIVSCSNLKPIKRVDLIVKTLSLIEDHEIEWIHFGDGVLKDEITALAKLLLSNKKNIKCIFKGSVINSEIHKFYAENHVDLFINVSESEGIPVSIMEAMSYGIPAIATNVGGTKELVDEDCGLLVSKDINEKHLARILSDELKIENLRKKSANAINKWEKSFRADTNFNEFVKQCL